jgi:hypothetical protein
MPGSECRISLQWQTVAAASIGTLCCAHGVVNQVGVACCEVDMSVDCLLQGFKL